ncbi:hypothetical protein HDU98_000531 [Podochytrium sp. JEL0797]|nr:hypothetical protein HDU98_000531 [Podochytrium sp. JEL0797]
MYKRAPVAVAAKSVLDSSQDVAEPPSRPPSQLDRRITTDRPRRETSYNAGGGLPNLPELSTFPRPAARRNSILSTPLSQELLEQAAAYENGGDSRVAFSLFKDDMMNEIDKRLFADRPYLKRVVVPPPAVGLQKPLVGMIRMSKAKRAEAAAMLSGAVAARGEKAGDGEGRRKRVQPTGDGGGGEEGAPRRHRSKKHDRKPGSNSLPDIRQNNYLVSSGGDGGGGTVSGKSRKANNPSVVVSSPPKAESNDTRNSNSTTPAPIDAIREDSNSSPAKTENVSTDDKTPPSAEQKPPPPTDPEPKDSESEYDSSDEDESDESEEDSNDYIYDDIDVPDRDVEQILSGVDFVLENQLIQDELTRSREQSAAMQAKNTAFLDKGLSQLVEITEEYNVTSKITSQQVVMQVQTAKLLFDKIKEENAKNQKLMDAAEGGAEGAWVNLDLIVPRTMPEVNLPHYSFHGEISTLVRLRRREKELENGYIYTQRSLRAAELDLSLVSDELEMVTENLQKIEKRISDFLHDITSLTNHIAQRSILHPTILQQIQTVVAGSLMSYVDFVTAQFTANSVARPSTPMQHAQNASLNLITAIKTVGPNLIQLSRQVPIAATTLSMSSLSSVLSLVGRAKSARRGHSARYRSTIEHKEEHGEDGVGGHGGNFGVEHHLSSAAIALSSRANHRQK